MRNDKVHNMLSQWAEEITQKYPWLIVKFEFCEQRNKYLVSFYPLQIIENSDEFNDDALRFEDEMYDLFGNDAPLFCDEDSLFKLSDNAETYPRMSENFIINSSSSDFKWAFSNEQSHNYEFDSNADIYPLAA